MVWSSCLAYLDVLISFLPFWQHLIHLEEVLEHFLKAGLILNSKKCNFGRRNVRSSGFNISSKGVLHSKKIIQAIVLLPRPQTKKEFKQFLDKMSYFRRHVRSFSTIAESLHRLERDNAKFEWTDEQKQAFITCVTLLSTLQSWLIMTLENRLNCTLKHKELA